MNRSIQSILDEVQPMLDQIRETGRLLAPFFAELARGIATLPDRTRDALVTLGSEGWYTDPELPGGALFRLAEQFDEQSGKDAANQLMCSYIDDRADAIMRALMDSYPTRDEILRQAFAAHKDRKYALSVPVFLAQADGICQELCGVQLYKDRGGALKKKVTGLNLDPVHVAMLAPLLEPLPLVAGSRDRNAHSSNLLNRHAILHGESVTYGTFENSCRAISLLSYTAWALKELVPNSGSQPR